MIFLATVDSSATVSPDLVPVILGCIGLNLALIMGVFTIFRREFIANRTELSQIRENSERLVMSEGIVSRFHKASLSALQYTTGALDWLAKQGQAGQTPPSEVLESMTVCMHELIDEVEKGAIELSLLSGTEEERRSAGRQLSERFGDVSSLGILDWRIKREEPGSRIRHDLDTAKRKLAAALDAAIHDSRQGMSSPNITSP